MRRNTLATLVAVLLMSGLLALPAVAQTWRSAGAGKSDCGQQQSMRRSSRDTLTQWSPDRGYYHQLGADDYGTHDQYGYDDGYDVYGYYFFDYVPDDQSSDEDTYDWYGDRTADRGYTGYTGYYSDFDYPRADPDEFVLYGTPAWDENHPDVSVRDQGRQRNLSRRDRQGRQDLPWEDEPWREDNRNGRLDYSSSPYEFQSTGWQFGRNIEAIVIGFEGGRSGNDVKLRVATPDDQRRVLHLGTPAYVRAHLPDIRKGDMIVVQGNMVQTKASKAPVFKAMQIIGEDGTVFPLQDSQLARGTSKTGRAHGLDYGSDTASRSGTDFEHPDVIIIDRVPMSTYESSHARTGKSARTRDTDRLSTRGTSWTLHNDIDLREDFSRRGERSKSDVDRAARFGFKNARNVESTYAKHEIEGKVVSLRTVDADELGGEVMVARIVTNRGQQVDAVLGSPERFGYVRPGSRVTIEGVTRLFDGSDTLIAEDVTLKSRDRSWSGGSDLARRQR